MILTRYIVFLILLQGSTGFGQNLMDKLSEIYVDESQSDSARVDAAIEMANRTYMYDLDSAEVLLNQAKIWSLNSNYKFGLARVDGFIGFIYHQRADYPTALRYYSRSIQYNLTHGFDVERAMDLDNYGTALNALDNPNAIEYFLESKAIYESKNMNYDLVFVYSHIANYYDKNMMTDSALYYFRKAIRICKDPVSSVSVNLGLSLLYSNINMLDSAEFYARNLVTSFKDLNDTSTLARSYAVLADVKFHKAEYDSALFYSDLTLGVYDHLTIMSRDNFFRTLSRTYQKLGNHQKSYQMMDSVLYYIDFTYSKDLRESAFLEAVQLELSLEKISDSLTYMAETERKELQHIIALEKESRTSLILVFGLIGLIIISIIGFIGYRRLAKKNKIILEQKELVDQKNIEREVLIREIHHRVKNNFQIICSVLRLQSGHVDDEKVQIVFEDAINRIRSMAQVHDMFYKNERFVDADPKEYFKNLTNSYKFCQKGREVNYNLITDVDSLTMDSLISLGLISNELITNSLKHAFHSVENSPEISLSLVNTGEKLEFYYQDNGPGFEKENLKVSFGMELVKTMTEQLNGEGEFNTEDGLRFDLIFPN